MRVFDTRCANFALSERFAIAESDRSYVHTGRTSLIFLDGALVTVAFQRSDRVGSRGWRHTDTDI
jgi:hypothetical protein